MTEIAVSTMSESEAERLTQRIELNLESAATAWEGAIDLIHEAYEKNAYVVLGFRSHGDYMREKFSAALSRLSTEQRKESVQELAEMGLSVRAIAPIVGTSKSQVARDLTAAVPSGTHEKTESRGDVVYEPTGEVIPAEFVDASDEQWESAIAAARENGDASQESVVKHLRANPRVPGPGGGATRSTVGIDGKSYTTSAKKPPRRRPITDVAYDLRGDMYKFAQRIRRFTEDDRVPRHREKLLDILKSTLDDLDLACLDLEEDLKTTSDSDEVGGNR